MPALMALHHTSCGPLGVVDDVVVALIRGGGVPREELTEVFDAASRNGHGQFGVLVVLGDGAPRPTPRLASALREVYKSREDLCAVVLSVQVDGFAGSFFLSYSTRLLRLLGLGVPALVTSGLGSAAEFLHECGLGSGQSCTLEQEVADLLMELQQHRPSRPLR